LQQDGMRDKNCSGRLTVGDTLFPIKHMFSRLIFIKSKAYLVVIFQISVNIQNWCTFSGLKYSKVERVYECWLLHYV